MGVLFFSLSFPLYALAPWSKVENRKFERNFRKAAQALLKRDTREASKLTGFSEDLLEEVFQSANFSILTKRFPSFNTTSPKTYPESLYHCCFNFYERAWRFILLRPEDRDVFQLHVLNKVEEADDLLGFVLSDIADAFGIDEGDIKGIFLYGSWLWAGLKLEPSYIRKIMEASEDIDFMIVTKKRPFHSAARLAYEVLGEEKVLDVQVVEESDFLRGKGPDMAFMKLLAYGGVQIRGPFYFEGEMAAFSHLLTLANAYLSAFLDECEHHLDFRKAALRLREAEIILNYILWRHGKGKVDFSHIWEILDKDDRVLGQIDTIQRFLIKQLVSAVNIVQEEIIIKKLEDLVSCST